MAAKSPALSALALSGKRVVTIQERPTYHERPSTAPIRTPLAFQGRAAPTSKQQRDEQAYAVQTLSFNLGRSNAASDRAVSYHPIRAYHDYDTAREAQRVSRSADPAAARELLQFANHAGILPVRANLAAGRPSSPIIMGRPPSPASVASPPKTLAQQPPSETSAVAVTTHWSGRALHANRPRPLIRSASRSTSRGISSAGSLQQQQQHQRHSSSLGSLGSLGGKPPPPQQQQQQHASPAAGISRALSQACADSSGRELFLSFLEQRAAEKARSQSQPQLVVPVRP